MKYKYWKELKVDTDILVVAERAIDNIQNKLPDGAKLDELGIYHQFNMDDLEENIMLEIFVTTEGSLEQLRTDIMDKIKQEWAKCKSEIEKTTIKGE